MLQEKKHLLTMAKILLSSLKRTSSLLRYSSVCPTSLPTALRAHMYARQYILTVLLHQKKLIIKKTWYGQTFKDMGIAQTC
jgi:hypothetical protein